ncbi:hypothetical protein ACFE04_016858 [Oxalis oulophora]
MGLNFKLNPKLMFPLQTLNPHLTSPSKPSSSARGREGSCSSAKSSYLSAVTEEGEFLCKERHKLQICSSTYLQILENDYSETIKVDIYNWSHKGTSSINNNIKTSGGENVFIPAMSLQKRNTSHFSLLVESLNDLEERFTDSEALTLEVDILKQLAKFGALQLFDTFLSKTLKNSLPFGFFDVPTEYIGEAMSCIDKIIVQSGKKEERKKRRQKESKSRIYSLSSSLKAVQKFELPAISSAEKVSNSKSRRLTMARNEAEMSKGLKVAVNLEKIRATLEKETGQVVSHSCWAKAAGVSEKTLQQDLRFGWYCRDELLRSTRSLVIYLARAYRGRGVSLDDLLQVGLVGVLQGAERFDHTRGYRFSTYVQYWIRKSMSKMITQHGSEIKIPYNLSMAMNRIKKAQKAINPGSKEYPSDDEIAMFTGLSLAKIKSARECQRVVGSIDQKIGDGFHAKYMEILPDTSVEIPGESVTRQHMKEEFYALLNGLSSKERQVLILRYGLEGFPPKTLEEIGKSFNVSKEWVRRIQKNALIKLRDEANKRNFSHYLRFLV